MLIKTFQGIIPEVGFSIENFVTKSSVSYSMNNAFLLENSFSSIIIDVDKLIPENWLKEIDLINKSHSKIEF